MEPKQNSQFPNNSNSLLLINVETLDKHSIHLRIPANSTVFELKLGISQKLKVDPSHQTLLFQNKRLTNQQSLNSLNIKSEDVLFLLSSTSHHSVKQINSEAKIISNVLTTLSENANNRLETKLKHLQNRTFGFSVLEKESKEIIKQNLLTVSQLHTSSTDLDLSLKNNSNTPLPFQLEKRDFKLGQWLDAKDMLGRWREAEVIAVTQDQVKVHFNSSESQTGEWVNKVSPRLSFFKNHSVQPSSTYFMSPVPSTPLTGDSSNLEVPFTQTNDLYKETSLALKNTAVRLKELVQLLQKKSQENNLKDNPELSVNQQSNTNADGRDFKREQKIPADNKSHFSLKFNDKETNPTLLMDDAKSVGIAEGPNFSHRLHKKHSVVATSPRSSKSIRSQFSSKIAFDHDDYHLHDGHEIIPEDLNQEISFDFEQEKNSIKTNQVYDYSTNEKNESLKILETHLISLKATQLAPIFDRLGRSLIDLSPHLASIGIDEGEGGFECLPAHVIQPNILGIFNRFREEASESSNQEFNANALMFKDPVDFQVPVMLTSGETSAVSNPGVSFLIEDNIDLNLHAVVKNKDDSDKKGIEVSQQTED